MTDASASRDRWQRWFFTLALLLPAVVFYAALYKTSCGLPIADDYDLLHFLNQWTQLHGLSKLLFLFTFQHNEYKIIFSSTVTAVQFSLMGHINFNVLNFVADSFVIGIFWILQRMFFASRQKNADKLLLLLPVSLLLFQLQYAIALSWAVATLQYLPVIFFSLLAIYLLSQPRSVALCVAGVSLVLAISASTNGFLIVPIGLAILLQQKRWKHAAIWAVTGILTTVAYASLYRLAGKAAAANSSIDAGKPSLLHTSPVYVLSFMGASIARYQSYIPSVILGLVFCGVLLFCLKQHYHLHNPSVFYSFLWIILTGVGVAYIRSSFGIAQSLASRYRIYSNLLLILAYIFFVETLLPNIKQPSRQRILLGAISFLCIVFCAASDVAGYRLLAGRQAATVYGIALWENPSLRTSNHPLNPDNNPVLKRQLEKGFYEPHTIVLEEAMQRGIYQPPRLSAP